jgi:AcrR family transcriptional regulator
LQVRERNKAEKRERIRRAALKLFSGQGYDATTLRDVAREARVALGTLSLYAADKRDLTLLVFNEITVNTMETAIDLTRSRDVPLEERMLAFFAPFFQDWASNPRLARIFLQINYYSGGMHGEDYTRSRRAIARQLEFIVEDAINRGEIRPPETTDIVAQHFFLIFSATARWWIGGDDPVAEEGIEYLRRLIRLQITGLSPRTARAAGTRSAR